MAENGTPENATTAAAAAGRDPAARNVRVSETPGGGYRVTVCAGTACVFAGSLAVYDAFVQEVQAAGLADTVAVGIIGCHGLCAMSPVVVLSDDTMYGRLRPDDVSEIVQSHLQRGAVVEKFLYKDGQSGRRIRDWHEIDFYKQQTRVALRNVGAVNPESLDEYVARGGYEAAAWRSARRRPSGSWSRSPSRASAGVAARASSPERRGSWRWSRAAT